MTKQHHEHGLLRGVLQADTSGVTGRVKAEGGTEPHAQARSLKAHDLADGPDRGVDDPVPTDPEVAGEAQDVRGEDEGRGGALAVVVVQEVRGVKEGGVAARAEAAQRPGAGVGLVETGLKAGDVLDEDVGSYAARAGRAEVVLDEARGLGARAEQGEEILGGDRRPVKASEGGLATSYGTDTVGQRRVGGSRQGHDVVAGGGTGCLPCRAAWHGSSGSS